MNKTYCVYTHIFPNGKKYIGVTCQKPEHRWNNGRGYRNNKYLERAINKYCWHNVEHKILYTDLLKEEAEEKEIELIKEWETLYNQNGYNLKIGGCVRGCFTEDTIRKMSLEKKGKTSNMKDKKLSNEAKMAISARKKGKKLSKTHINNIVKSRMKNRKVQQYTKDGVFLREFVNFKEAELITKINDGNICECCHNHRKTAGGYIWKYEAVI